MQKHISAFFHDIGWESIYNFTLTHKQDLDQYLEAFIDMESWTININYSINIFQEFAKLISEHQLTSQLERPLYLEKNCSILNELDHHHPWEFHAEFYEMIGEILLHETGHSQECPIDNDRFAEIIHAITTALHEKKKAGIRNVIYVANQFTDLIVNVINGLEPSNRFVRNGFFLFYFLELVHQNNFDISFGLFLLTNIKLILHSQNLAKKLEKEIIPRLFSGYEELLNKLVRIFCPYDEILEKINQNKTLTENQRWKIINYLTISESWEELAYDYALIIADYLEENEETPIQNIPLSSFTYDFLHNKEYRKEINDNIIDSQLTHEELNNIGNFQQSGISIKNRIDKPYPRYGDLQIGQLLLEDVDYLDCLYRQRLQRIELRNLQKTKSKQNPVIWLNRSIMTDYDNIMDFDPLNVFFLPNSEELLLYKKSLPLDPEFIGSKDMKSFPNLAIIYDDSGSMNWDYHTGTGKYDYLIIMIYSIWKWLSNQSQSPVIEYNLTAFSSTTRSSGWIDYYHFETLLKLLFNKESQGTLLDPKELEKILCYPREKAVLLISDGEISSSSKILKLLKQYKSQISFLMIQIGSMSKFARKLLDFGFQVQIVKKAEDLRGLALDFLKKVYD